MPVWGWFGEQSGVAPGTAGITWVLTSSYGRT